MRNILNTTPKRLQKQLLGRLATLFGAADIETAKELLNRTLTAYQRKAPRVMNILKNGFDDAPAVLALLEGYRRKLRTTNAVEKLNEEIRRREYVIRSFLTKNKCTAHWNLALGEKRRLGNQYKVHGYDTLSGIPRKRREKIKAIIRIRIWWLIMNHTVTEDGEDFTAKIGLDPSFPPYGNTPNCSANSACVISSKTAFTFTCSRTWLPSQ